jgi:hypothetical protein
MIRMQSFGKNPYLKKKLAHQELEFSFLPFALLNKSLKNSMINLVFNQLFTTGKSLVGVK